MAADRHDTRKVLHLPNPEAPFAALVELADEVAHGGKMLHGTRAMARGKGCQCAHCRSWERGFAAARRDRQEAA